MTSYAEAFRELSLLESEDFSLNNDEEIQSLSNFISDDEDEEIDDTVDIIDLDAETEDELKDSYIGDVILECPVCHTRIFKNKDDIVVEEDSEYVNVDEECPVCLSEGGFEIIGEVAPYVPKGEETKVEVDDEEVEIEEPEDNEDDDEKNESLSLKEWTSHPDNYNLYTVNNLDGYGNHYENKSFDKALAWAEKNMKDGFTIRGTIDLEDGGSDSEEVYSSEDGFVESLKEGFEHVNVETEDQVMDMSQDENGKVTVTTEPKSAPIGGDEMVAPVGIDTAADILDTNEEPTEPVENPGEVPEDEIPEEAPEMSQEPEDIDVDLEDVDEETFNQVGESYFKKVYGNVNSFKLNEVKEKDNTLIAEGLITFSNGDVRKTTFKFTPQTINRNNKVRFIGENLEITPNHKRAFVLNGTLKTNKENKAKLVTESMSYRYGLGKNKILGKVSSK